MEPFLYNKIISYRISAATIKSSLVCNSPIGKVTTNTLALFKCSLTPKSQGLVRFPV